ncbi:MAG TPA: hypothetical protein VK063_08650 [Beutenbergiaceae bacterium]|nr:hypothetical protein [Beutenbergiaceae bacterium]
MDLSRLRGWFVVEAGRRQAWPFIVLSDPDTGTEVRVYIDTTFSVRPGWQALRQDDDAVLAALDSLQGLTVTAGRSGPGGLLVQFGQHELRVETQPNDLTTHDVWWVDP